MEPPFRGPRHSTAAGPATAATVEASDAPQWQRQQQQRQQERRPWDGRSVLGVVPSAQECPEPGEQSGGGGMGDAAPSSTGAARATGPRLRTTQAVLGACLGHFWAVLWSIVRLLVLLVLQVLVADRRQELPREQQCRTPSPDWSAACVVDGVLASLDIVCEVERGR
ncbi:uncharacterized protein LOC112540069 isoform X3 [Python bivittatus]|uniref:Uncharacterized protein LOC112540069 isoform X3 n=1 Tax=Python bivittatus TaxID=176946 RepID=A0A9F5MNP9_PYTBI|nr:uncharacterized protein LOC112540069 isoform X3 [Python bivittatus]